MGNYSIFGLTSECPIPLGTTYSGQQCFMQGFVHIRFVGRKFIPFGIWKKISHVINNTTLVGKSARSDEIDLFRKTKSQKPSQPVGFAKA
jgi:hypothetical protein